MILSSYAALATGASPVAGLPRAAASPTPFPDYTGNQDLITPGVWGFIAILLVAIATIFLLIDMTRRIRRSRYREEVRIKLEAEQEEADAAAAAAARKAARGGSSAPKAAPSVAPPAKPTD